VKSCQSDEIQHMFTVGFKSPGFQQDLFDRDLFSFLRFIIEGVDLDALDISHRQICWHDSNIHQKGGGNVFAIIYRLHFIKKQKQSEITQCVEEIQIIC